MAHHQPELLDRLLGRISASWSYGFIHVDAKSDVRFFAPIAAKHPQWSVLDDSKRINVQWSGFSSVVAILNLMREAIAARPDTERFFLLSGVDYPLRPIEEIGRALAEDRDLIQIDRKLNPNGTSEFDRRANRVFLGDYGPLNPRAGRPRLSGQAMEIGNLIRRSHPKRISVYHGACWWCLTRKAVDFALRFVAERRDVVKWFRHTAVPDEMFFQTILKSEGYEGRLACDATINPELNRPPTSHAAHYIDWEHPNPVSPRVLDMEDFTSLKSSSALFARKFDVVRSRELLDCLDKDSLG